MKALKSNIYNLTNKRYILILDDKISLPRTKGLPNARTVSDIVHRNFFLSETLSKELTLHVMGFGQFLDHDIARTPEQDGNCLFFICEFLC
jgi:hypothetical protein